MVYDTKVTTNPAPTLPEPHTTPDPLAELRARAEALSPPHHALPFAEGFAAARAGLAEGDVAAARQGVAAALPGAPDAQALAMVAYLWGEIGLRCADHAEAMLGFAAAAAAAEQACEARGGPHGPDTEALRILGLARLRMGVLRAAAGDVAAAAAAMAGSTGLLAALAGREDAPLEATCDLAEAEILSARWLAAPRLADQARQRLEAVLREAPDLDQALTLLADALVAPGASGPARTRLEQAVSLRLRCLQATPDDPIRLADLARVWVALGKQFLSEASPALAGPAFAQADAIADRLPAHLVDAKPLKFAALLGLGDAARAEADHQAATQAYALAAALAQAAQSPSHDEPNGTQSGSWQREEAVAWSRIAEAALAGGAIAAAEQAFSCAARLLEGAEGVSLRDKGITAGRWAETALRCGRLDEAERQFAAAIATAEAHLDGAPTDRAVRHRLSQLYARRGVAFQALGNLSEASRHWETALALCDGLARWDEIGRAHV